MKHTFFLFLTACISCSAHAQKIPLKPGIGIATSLENDSMLAAAGYSGIIESVGRRISPRALSDSAFRKSLPLLKNRKLPILAFNLFLPADLKVVGPQVDEKAILDYVEIVLNRVSQTDTRMIVWGSGGSRQVPDGFDRKTAKAQFVAIAKKIAAVAQKYGIVLALENLNSGETNFINTVRESLSIVKRVNHPNLRLNADIYHMMKDGEPPAIIRKAKKYLVHVEIAEPEHRTAPGVTGTNFRPYLRELRKAGYHNHIVIEGRWDKLADIAISAFRYLSGEIDAVYRGE